MAVSKSLFQIPVAKNCIVPFCVRGFNPGLIDRVKVETRLLEPMTTHCGEVGKLVSILREESMARGLTRYLQRSQLQQRL